MDRDYGHGTPPAKVMRDEPEAPLTPVEAVFVKDKKSSQVPYLAKLTAFSVLFLSVLYSLSSLITYLVDKLIIKPGTNNYDYSYFSSWDSFMVISAVSALIVTLPIAAILLFCVRRDEASETWRSSQKWRRVIYTILQVILIVSIVSTLIGTVYTIFSNSLHLDMSSSYYGTGGDAKPDPQAGNKITAAIISGFAAVIIFVLGGVTFMGEYAKKWRSVAWGILALFAVTAGIVGTVSVMKVQEHIKKEVDSQSKVNTCDYSGCANYDGESNSSNSSDTYSTAQSDLEAVKSDLNYYASSNAGKYPTKAQWDDGSLKSKYLLSSDETLKKITYTPTCTKIEPPTCSSYTISMKNENGKTITLTSDSNPASSSTSY